jgi:hypothetical protein
MGGLASQRCVAQALQLILGRLFGGQVTTPCAGTGRMWVLRLGLYELRRPKETADDWVWIVDHTIQISSVKCLLIIGCRLRQWVQDRRPLEHHDVQVLMLEPVEKSSGEIVCEQFTRLALQTGVPRAILSDGGTDLVSGAAFFQSQHPHTALVYDIAHKMALLLKKTLTQDARWQEFLKKMASSKKQSTRSGVAFLAPPMVPDQARYMNLNGLLKWARSLIQFLQNANDNSFAPRWQVNLKFEWILEFEADLLQWQILCNIVQASLHFVRWEGYFPGAEDHLRARLARFQGSPSADLLIQQILQFIAEQSRAAKPGERLLGSSECIESLIGKGKRLEGQQSRSGFTAMVLGIAAAVVKPTRETIQAAFHDVKTKDVAVWAKNAFGRSVQACRRLALKDPLTEQKQDQQLPATAPGF